jgi:hypothetical protein
MRQRKQERARANQRGDAARHGRTIIAADSTSSPSGKSTPGTGRRYHKHFGLQQNRDGSNRRQRGATRHLPARAVVREHRRAADSRHEQSHRELSAERYLRSVLEI